MANNDPYNVKTELTDGIDSIARFSTPDGGLHPQRIVLHEMIIQTVSERKILLQGKDFEESLRHSVNAARRVPTFQELEKSGDYTPEKMVNPHFRVHVKSESCGRPATWIKALKRKRKSFYPCASMARAVCIQGLNADGCGCNDAAIAR